MSAMARSHRPRLQLEDLRAAAHRLAGLTRRQLITRGDSLRRSDAPVNEEQVLGRVVCVTRNGRHIGLEFTRKRRMAAWVLRKSDLAGRVFLRFTRRSKKFYQT